jgi:hypothetical protein
MVPGSLSRLGVIHGKYLEIVSSQCFSVYGMHYTLTLHAKSARSLEMVACLGFGIMVRNYLVLIESCPFMGCPYCGLPLSKDGC